MASPKRASSRAGERKRDEARDDSAPKFAGGEWDLADEREPDERFGKSRSDNAENGAQIVSEHDDAPEVSYEPAGDGSDADDDLDTESRDEEPDSDAQLAADQNENIESSAQPEGMSRGSKPGKPKRRTKANPKPSTKTKKKASTRAKAKKSRR
jgi:hypothetical protein